MKKQQQGKEIKKINATKFLNECKNEQGMFIKIQSVDKKQMKELYEDISNKKFQHVLKETFIEFYKESNGSSYDYDYDENYEE